MFTIAIRLENKSYKVISVLKKKKNVLVKFDFLLTLSDTLENFYSPAWFNNIYELPCYHFLLECRIGQICIIELISDPPFALSSSL